LVKRSPESQDAVCWCIGGRFKELIWSCLRRRGKGVNAITSDGIFKFIQRNGLMNEDHGENWCHGSVK
jgi:hypothetical protein